MEGSPRRLLIIGNRGGTNVGESFERAAAQLGVTVNLLESRGAMQAPRWWVAIRWHLDGHTPARLEEFSRKVLAHCEQFAPDLVLTTGLAPVNAWTLRRIGEARIRRANFLTDDPWNPVHHAPWFLRALAEYDFIFSPRLANLQDLRQASRARVEYVPFGYDPALFYPVVLSAEEKARYEADVMFAGGADADRVAYPAALAAAGLRVALYGSYWERYRPTRSLTRGQLPPDRLRRVIAASKIALCLVRRANRDGHVMRTFEIPAVGACMLTEDTAEHREIFGEDGEAVRYFRTVEEMVERARWLLAHDEERKRLAAAAHRLITGGHHCYSDRLRQMLNTAGE